MFKSYTDVRDWLENFIPQTYTKKELGLERICYLLKQLGNPQNKFKSIHIAGTSGKGSTAFYTARLLQESKSPSFAKASEGKQRAKRARGFKIGLHISPHLVDIRERMQIVGGETKRPFETQGKQRDKETKFENLMPMKRFIELVNEIKPQVEAMKTSKVGSPSYFEILVAASFLYFAKEKVDWAVIEVGLGGRLDATNVLKPELSIITNIGLDHTDILGKTIEKISFEKSGIIKEKIPVITTASGRALEVIKNIVKKKKASLITLNTQIGVQTLKSDINSYLTLYNDILKSSNVFFTKDVFFLSLAAVVTLKIPVNKAKIIEAFSASFPARFEEIAPNVVIDGAHNLEKIKTLVSFIKTKFPAKKISLVVAFKKGKDWKKMLEYLVKNLDIERCYTNQFYSVTDMGFFAAVDPEEIRRFMINDLRFKNVKVKAFENSQQAVFTALRVAPFEKTQGKQGKHSDKRSLVLVTGSLYLAGEARSVWF